MQEQSGRLSRPQKIMLLIAEAFCFFFALMAFSYSGGLLKTWFDTAFADNGALLSSFGLFALAMAFPFIGIVLYKRYSSIWQIVEFPKDISKEEYPKWRTIATRIKIRRSDMSYNIILAMPSLYVGYFLMFTSLWLLSSLARYHYLDFLSHFSPIAQALSALGLLVAISLILTVIPMLLVVAVTLEFMSKYLDFPTDEDIIFAESFIISYNLSVNDRKGAQKEITAFVRSLTAFSRNWFNSKRRAYSQEIATIRNNRTALSRMILFAPNSLIDHVGELFLRFGLSLRNWDDAACFANLESLIMRLDDYRPLGRMQRVLNSIERYPKLIAILIAVCAVLIGLAYPQLAALIG